MTPFAIRNLLIRFSIHVTPNAANTANANIRTTLLRLGARLALINGM